MRHTTFIAAIMTAVIASGFSAKALAASSSSVLTGSVLSGQKEGTWSGSANLFIVTGNRKSTQLNFIDDESPIISSLDAEPGDFDFSTFFETLRLNYNLSDTTQFSLGIFDTGLTTNSLIENQSLVAISARKTFVDRSEVWVSLSPNIPGLYEAWQDPYLTGSPLRRTDAKLQVLAIGANYIFGSPFSISTSFGTHEIENDNAGMALGAQLTTDQLTQLRRDTRFANIRIAGLLPLSESFYLEGGLTYFRSDADGDANSFDAKGVDLSLVYTINSLDMYLSAKFDVIDFELSNPVFEQKREEDFYNIYAGVRYNEPFGLAHFSVHAFVSALERDSNITFFDEEETTLALGVTYAF